ncbi:MAG: hypothetical protein R2834_02425 [Rhodothermales bacterium]
MRHLFLLAALVWSIGCATTTNVPQDTRTRIYNKSATEAQQAAVQLLEANGYSVDVSAIQVGMIKGEKPLSTIAAALVGDGRFELSFLIREAMDGKTSVTISPRSYSSNAFGVERQDSFTGKQIQALVDDAFAQYTVLIGGGDLGSVASAKASEADASGRLDCSDSSYKADQLRVVVASNTPVYTLANTNSAMMLHLNAGVDVVTYRTQGDFTQICSGESKGWVKTNTIGKKRMSK